MIWTKYFHCAFILIDAPYLLPTMMAMALCSSSHSASSLLIINSMCVFQAMISEWMLGFFYYCDGCSVGENSIKMLIDLAQNSEYVFIYTNMFSQTINVTHISLVSVLLAENRLSPKRSLFLWSFICRTFPLSFHSSLFYDYYTLQIFEF